MEGDKADLPLAAQFLISLSQLLPSYPVGKQRIVIGKATTQPHSLGHRAIGLASTWRAVENQVEWLTLDRIRRRRFLGGQAAPVRQVLEEPVVVLGLAVESETDQPFRHVVVRIDSPDPRLVGVVVPFPRRVVSFPGNRNPLTTCRIGRYGYRRP